MEMVAEEITSPITHFTTVTAFGSRLWEVEQTDPILPQAA
jgi:hypothetical protein